MFRLVITENNTLYKKEVETFEEVEKIILKNINERFDESFQKIDFEEIAKYLSIKYIEKEVSNTKNTLRIKEFGQLVFLTSFYEID